MGRTRAGGGGKFQICSANFAYRQISRASISKIQQIGDTVCAIQFRQIQICQIKFTIKFVVKFQITIRRIKYQNLLICNQNSNCCCNQNTPSRRQLLVSGRAPDTQSCLYGCCKFSKISVIVKLAANTISKYISKFAKCKFVQIKTANQFKSINQMANFK